MGSPPIRAGWSRTLTQDERYAEAVAAFAPALGRLVRGFEADPERRRDLLQDIHVQLWRSLATFDGECSLRTWTYRVAHNVHATHVLRSRRLGHVQLVGLEELESVQGRDDPAQGAAEQQALDRLRTMLQRLKPPDAQVMSLYLEDIPAAEIADIVGLSSVVVATRIHRVKALLARTFHMGSNEHGQT